MTRIFALTLLFVVSCYSCLVLAKEPQSNVNKIDVVSLLNNMAKAVVSRDYIILFVRSIGDDLLGGAFEYRHAVIANKQFARLFYLEGTVKKILQRDRLVNYYQQGHQPFSISSDRIIEVFPEVVFNDFSKLSRYYDFISIGRARLADRSVQLVRVVPKYSDRNNYVIWISEDLFIPLRIDLYNSEFRLLEQFKVVSLSPLTEHASILNDIEASKQPLVLTTSHKASGLPGKWLATWLPVGFSEQAQSQIDYKKKNIDTRLYSDGVFSFTINVSKDPTMTKTHSLQSGNHIVYITRVFDKEITIIGDLPLATIKKIAKQIKMEPF